MKLLDQPHRQVVGDKLKEILSNNAEYGFDTFYILVAYVKTSGVSRLQSEIEQFKSSGGQVKAVVGIGQKNTSIQGLQQLLPLCDNISIYHNENQNIEFPKNWMYLIQLFGGH